MESAILVLKGFNAVSSANNTVEVWNNINLRVLLGDLYDKYDRFKLSLNNISIALTDGALGTTINDTLVSLNISGLPFINSSYNTTTGNNTDTVCLTNFRFIRGAVSNYYYTDNTYAIFGKSQDCCNITIRLLTIFNDSQPSTSVPFPNVNYTFNIIGIPNEDVKTLIAPTRMDNNTGRIDKIR